MKGRYVLILMLLSLTLGKTFAHQDFLSFRNYGNVKVRVKTGFRYEEINKAFIIGQLTEKLAADLNYKDTIFLDFIHYYVGETEPVYFVSFDKVWNQYSLDNKDEANLFEQETIAIRQISRTFNVVKTLKLVEYSIKNLRSIKSSQKEVASKKRFDESNFMSIEASKINRLFSKDNSKLINKVLHNRIYRKENSIHGISYYWQDNKFFVIDRPFNKPEQTLIELENIYDFQQQYNYYFVFDSDSSFYYLNPNKKQIISNKQTIQNNYEYYQPFKIEYISRNKISITFPFYTKELGIQPKEKTLLYLTDKDELIQDLDKTLENCK